MRRAGEALLRRLRKERPKIELSDKDRRLLMDQLGTTTDNVDELLSLEEEEEP